MRTAIIINPVSGRHGRRPSGGENRRALAVRIAREIGADTDVVVTRAAGHGAELAAAFVAKRIDRVIAWGGDGTINEVAGPLVGSETVLGIVPSGSGDGLAHGLGLPRQKEPALRLALTGEAKAIDVGYLGERHFLNIAGIGFDAAVGQIFNRRKKRGALGYLTAFRLVWTYESRECALEVDGNAMPGRRFLIAFANGPEYGNGAIIAPGADYSDGRLDAVIVSAGSPFRQLWRARRLVIGRQREAEGVRRCQLRTARMSGQDLQCHVDGETFDFSGTLVVRLAPLALRVVSGPGAGRRSGADR